jgi:hypothetical protein
MILVIAIATVHRLCDLLRPEPYGRQVRLDPQSQVAITDAFELVLQPAQDRNSVLEPFLCRGEISAPERCVPMDIRPGAMGRGRIFCGKALQSLDTPCAFIDSALIEE